MKRALVLLSSLTILGLAATLWAAAVSEAPSGQQNVEVLNLRDQNALPTPRANYWDQTANNAAGITVPTPAAGHCIYGDTVAGSATDTFAILCNNGLTTQILKLKPGTATAGTAPLQFTAGTLLSSVEAGAMEYFANAFWLTNLAVRRTIVQAQGVPTTTTTLANSAAETTVYTQAHGANYLQVGKQEDILLVGTVSSLNNGNTNTLTIRVKYAGSTQATFVMPEAARSTVGWELRVLTTVRAIGAGTGSQQVYAKFDLNNEVNDPSVNALASSLDTTTAQATTVTFQWSDADAGDTVSVLQARSLSIDNNS